MLNRRSMLFLVLALVFGGIAMLLARSYLAKASMESLAEEVEMVEVAVAARTLSVGSAIVSEDLRLVEWPKLHLPAHSFHGKTELVGRVLRHPVEAGDPILDTLLLPEGAAPGLVSMIEEGHRAVSVKVDAVIGVAGFVKPGARVDVLATLRRANNDNFSKVVLQDVRVLAVDQTLEEVDNVDPEVVNVVTLEVLPAEAERLTHAAHEGRLQLALRNPGDQETVNTRAVRATDLYGPRPRAPRTTKRARREVIETIKGTERSESQL